MDSSQKDQGLLPEAHHYPLANHDPPRGNELGTWMAGHFQSTSTIGNMFKTNIGPTIKMTEKEGLLLRK